MTAITATQPPVDPRAPFLVESTTVDAMTEIAPETFLCRLRSQAIAAAIQPGQFMMVRLDGRDSPLIARPFAFYRIVDRDGVAVDEIEFVFLRKGAFTTALSRAPRGTPLAIWGPLGNAFSNHPCETLVMAVGGIGQTPMLLLAQEALGARAFGLVRRPTHWAQRVVMVYGARTAAALSCVDDFRAAGIDVHLCTDDGSIGPPQRVPDRLFELLDGDLNPATTRVVTCGPEPMMEIVATGCQKRAIDCQVSMETPMACGIGICFSCVAKIRTQPHKSDDWDYRRTCTEGPIFDADQVVW